MMCYNDMKFCSADCDNQSCRRKFTEADRRSARTWWSHDPDNVPIAWRNFSADCPQYKEPTV